MTTSDKVMTLYNYDKITKELSSESIAQESPLEKGVYLVPAGATLKKPLKEKDTYAVCFDEQENDWVYIEDHRDKVVYSTKTKEGFIVDCLGPIKDGFTLDKPDTYDTWLDTKWVEDAKMVNIDRINSIKNRAGEIILSRYPIIKQMNIYGEDGDEKIEMVAWIKNIRDISNKAEKDGTALEDIVWE